jgi:phospholipase C
MKLIHILGVAAVLGVLTACAGVGSSTSTPPPSSAPPGDISSVNHIVIMLQENRSFDHYFGFMTQYRQANGFPINSADGKIRDVSDAPGFTNTSAVAGPIAPYVTHSTCTEDLSPDWLEHHIQINANNPAAASPTNAPMDGFVRVSLGESRAFAAQVPPIVLSDQTGHRAMGFFDDSILNYYYFMASNFAISDNLHSPLPANTTANRMYIHAATSQGFVHTPTAKLSAKTIWQSLDEKGVSWKIYVSDFNVSPFRGYLTFFTYFTAPGVSAKVVPLDDYFNDLKAGTLPAVAFIEAGYQQGLDEHTSNVDPRILGPHRINVQNGATRVAHIINSLIQSSSWKDSVFLFAFDEGGGAFDHVPPIAVPNPDGMLPRDLINTPTKVDPPGDFTMSGVRVPNMIISPFAKKNFVSHTPIDYTAFLKFVETRFGLAALTQRDASMPDMTEFFDFTNGGPWATPPANIPTQHTNGVCDFTQE